VVNDNGMITTTDYAGNFIYENNVLQFFNQPEGYVEISSPPSGELEGAYVYQYKDHLGNIRLSYSDANHDGSITASTEIKEENNYYPFGLKHKGYNTAINGTHHKYMFGGKELSEELGLNTYDFGWRNYDAALGRWFGIDNLAEKYVSSSPYHYAGNNPILNYDIDGNEFTESAWKWVNKLIADVNSRQERNNGKIADKQAQLAEGGLTKSKISRLNNQISRLQGNNTDLENVRGEVATLAASDQVYDVVTDSGGTERDAVGSTTTTNSTSVNFANGNVEITVSSGTGLDLFAHELKHAHQFEIGEASFGERNGKGFSFLLDKNDELAGYQRQALFGSNGGVTNINNLPDNYNSLPTGPVNIHNLNPAVINIVRTGNNIQLQALANQRNQAFRVNNRTFIPNNNRN